MARTANTEPKQDTYLIIGGETIGFKTQKNMIQFCAMSAFNADTMYHKFDGYRVEDNESIVEFSDKENLQVFRLAQAIADNGFKCCFRLSNDLVIRFQTRLKQLHYLMLVAADVKNWNKWRSCGGEQIGEPRLIDWDNMTTDQKIEFFSSL